VLFTVLVRHGACEPKQYSAGQSQKCVWLLSNRVADRQGNWRRPNLRYASELRKCVLILDSAHSSIQQDLITKNKVLYGFELLL
jgi:hypothetical protein